MSEFVGFKEKWVERGWTRKQMRERIEELGLTVNSWCVLQPYELNFMQNPNANQEIEEDVESGERAIGVSCGHQARPSPCRVKRQHWWTILKTQLKNMSCKTFNRMFL